MKSSFLILCDQDELIEITQSSLRLMLEDNISTLMLCDKRYVTNDASTMLDSDDCY